MNAITHRQFFGDGERDFSLGLPQVHELERLVGAGIGALCKRLLSGDYSLADLHQIIRLGLIGGGSSPHEAHDLMSAYVYPRPIEEAQIIAISVLSAAYFGQPTDEASA